MFSLIMKESVNKFNTVLVIDSVVHMTYSILLSDKIPPFNHCHIFNLMIKVKCVKTIVGAVVLSLLGIR
jgi:hypothetical protein